MEFYIGISWDLTYILFGYFVESHGIWCSKPLLVDDEFGEYIAQYIGD